MVPFPGRAVVPQVGAWERPISEWVERVGGDGVVRTGCAKSFKNISLLFGCIGPSLWCVGSSLQCKTLSCGVRAGLLHRMYDLSLLYQGLNPCLRHSSVDSKPPDHQGRPGLYYILSLESQWVRIELLLVLMTTIAARLPL